MGLYFLFKGTATLTVEHFATGRMKKSWTILTGESGKEALQARVQDLQVITQVRSCKALITLHHIPFSCIVLLGLANVYLVDWNSNACF